VTDEIRLILPAQEDFHQIARLVVGGLAARLELTFEQLEDLEVALDVVLRCREDAGDLSISLDVDTGTVSATVGPFSAEAVAMLEHDGGELDLRRVLDTVADGVEIEQRDGDSWVRFAKAVT
jgi:hypothetical protein